MDYFYSYDPLVIVFSGVGVVIFSILFFEFSCYIRSIIPKSVKCWFCKYKTEVKYSLRNSWTCPGCDQYNGFSEDGGYNKIIASQHDESLNLIAAAHQIPSNQLKRTSQLCNKCNLKQQLKVEQLAAFVPIHKNNYDKEIEHFREQIEKTYQLCETCELLVTNVLQNLREELSLPKKLISTLSQVKIRGETAVYINLILSLLLTGSSLQGKISLPDVVTECINELTKYIYFLPYHLFLFKIFSYWIQLIIAAGFLVNSIGFYQTKSTSILLNCSSWILMFFLTLYPAEFDKYIEILKTISGTLSFSIGLFILLKNNEQKSKNKKMSEKRNLRKTPSVIQNKPNSSRDLRTPTTSPVSTNGLGYSMKENKYSPNEEVLSSRIHNKSQSSAKLKISNPVTTTVQNNIDVGLSNLNLGLRHRRDTKQQNSKPVLTPPKFNPFSGTRNCNTPIDKSCPCKPSTPISFNHYEPSISQSGCEGSCEASPFTQFNCTPPFYSSCSPTLVYYYSAQSFPKPSVMHHNTSIIEGSRNENKMWAIINSLPVLFLVCCNVFLIFFVYNKEITSVKN